MRLQAILYFRGTLFSNVHSQIADKPFFKYEWNEKLVLKENDFSPLPQYKDISVKISSVNMCDFFN